MILFLLRMILSIKKGESEIFFHDLTTQKPMIYLGHNQHQPTQPTKGVSTMPYSTPCCDDIRDARLCLVMSSDEERKLADSVSRTVQRARIRAKYIVLYGFDPFKVANRDRVDMVALERLFQETPLS